jgi:hypothetical protein
MGLEKKKRRNAYRIQPQEEIKLWKHRAQDINPVQQGVSNYQSLQANE